ncbi:MAG: hypothetical protein ACKOHM_13095 [Spartobacteria bacterium]
MNNNLGHSEGFPKNCDIREATTFDAPLLASFTFPLFRDRLLVGAWKHKVIAFGAWLGSKPVGLVLFEKTSGRVAVLRSIWVEQDCRRQWVGLTLLLIGSDACLKQGFQKLEAVHRSTLEDRIAFESLLTHEGWSKPRIRMMVLEATYQEMLKSPVMGNPPELDVAFRSVPWHEVDSREIERLAATRQFHVEVWPLNYGPDFHRETSVGLMHQGELVGWVVNHPKSPGVLRFTTSWLREDLQGKGTFAAVIAESYHRMAGTGYDHGIWTVPAIFPRMVAFARRRLAPYCYRVSETLGSELFLEKKS